MTSPDLSGAVERVPHCQLCGGDVEGWICQTCESDFEEVDGLLLLKSDNTHSRLEARALAAEAALSQAREAAEKDGEALKPFAALADKFGCYSVVEVCVPDPGNPSPVIQPVPVAALETALDRIHARARLNERKPT